MSIATDRLLARTTAYISTMTPAMSGKILRAYQIMRDSLTDAEITALLNAGHTAEHVALALTKQPWFENAITTVGTGAQDLTLRAAAQYRMILPTSVGGAWATIGIDMANPLIGPAMAKMKSAATANLTKTTRDTLTQTVKSGMERGLNSKRIAKELRSVIGLSPNQSNAVTNFERMLRSGDRMALTRELRNHRYDAQLLKGLGPKGTGLTEAQITKMAEAYRTRMISFNAHQQARTLANDAMRNGQRLSWESAIDMGMVDRATLFKQRVTMRDEKVRDEHALMDGEVRQFDERYTNGEMVVGDLDWGCRCHEVYFTDPTGTRFGKGKGPQSKPGPAGPRCWPGWPLLALWNRQNETQPRGTYDLANRAASQRNTS